MVLRQWRPSRSRLSRAFYPNSQRPLLIQAAILLYLINVNFLPGAALHEEAVGAGQGDRVTENPNLFWEKRNSRNAPWIRWIF